MDESIFTANFNFVRASGTCPHSPNEKNSPNFSIHSAAEPLCFITLLTPACPLDLPYNSVYLVLLLY